MEPRDREIEDTLREMIYEITHLSPERDDGSHWCKISKKVLQRARAVFKDSHRG